MKSTCDIVAERVALGEPLGDAAGHAASCTRCRAIVALPGKLGATHHEIDPGIGFAARMTAGTQHLLGVRRRRRIAVGVAAATMAAAVAVVVVTRTPHGSEVATAPHETKQPATNPHEKEPTPDPWKQHDVDDDVRALVHLANIERSAHLSANWGRIEKPLRPYRAVVKGTTP